MNIPQPYAESDHGTQVLAILEKSVAYNSWLFSKIEPYLGNANAEIGAGQGTISTFALAKSRCLLTDYSDHNRLILKKRFEENLNLIKVTRDIPSAELFDCIFSSNVLEHIQDDETLILRCMENLKPGGHFVAVVPAMHFLYTDFDRSIGHYRRYSFSDRRRFRKLCATKPNISLELFKFFNPIGAIGWLLKMVILKNKTISQTDARMSERLVPLYRAIDFLPTPFGQSAIIVFKRLP